MRAFPLLVVAAICVTLPVCASADVSSFVVRLGADTVSVETCVRSPGRLEIDQVIRSPQTQRRHFVYEFTGERLASAIMNMWSPGDTTSLQTITGVVDGDSIRVGTRSALLPRDALVIRSPIPWSLYEIESARMLQAGADSLRTDMTFLGAQARWWLRLRRLGPDSIEIANQHDDLFHARVDREGRILGVKPVDGTFKVHAERVAFVDLEALTSSFVARDREGAVMGTLSPRDTVESGVGGASIWVDYGRPARRGRSVFGSVVPWGKLWRTGANAATQFRCDHDLDFGGIIVSAGIYSLWTIPSPEHWVLIVNTESGQWGTRHDEARDLLKIPMLVEGLPTATEMFTIQVVPTTTGGVLRFEWDTTRASAPFRVRQ